MSVRACRLVTGENIIGTFIKENSHPTDPAYCETQLEDCCFFGIDRGPQPGTFLPRFQPVVPLQKPGEVTKLREKDVMFWFDKLDLMITDAYEKAVSLIIEADKKGGPVTI